MSICSHLSPSLYDLVLNLVYDYASTTVRSNAVRGIHLLIEALANANPAKCLAKFFPLCERNIRIELENGASSLRTTLASSPLPSDATLHWRWSSFLPPHYELSQCYSRSGHFTWMCLQVSLSESCSDIF